MAKRRRKLNGLGAVEGEKVEYFLPASIVNALRGSKSIAFCAANVEDYLPVLEYKSKLAARKAERAKKDEAYYSDPGLVALIGEQHAARIQKKAESEARKAKSRAKTGDIFEQTADEIRKDLAAIRAQGITGPIPACVYRTSGKYGDKALKTAEARANRFHERFHADTRREEHKAGRGYHDCELEMAKVLGADLDTELRGFSADYWTVRGRAPVEEILARVEEVQNACGSDEKDPEACGQVMGRINDWFISKQKPELAAAFVRVTAATKARFSSPLGVVKAACKVR